MRMGQPCKRVTTITGRRTRKCRSLMLIAVLIIVLITLLVIVLIIVLIFLLIIVLIVVLTILLIMALIMVLIIMLMIAKIILARHHAQVQVCAAPRHRLLARRAPIPAPAEVRWRRCPRAPGCVNLELLLGPIGWHNCTACHLPGCRLQR